MGIVTIHRRFLSTCFVAVLLACSVVHVRGEASQPYVMGGSFLFYPNYTMADFEADMKKLTENTPQKSQLVAIAEEKALEFLTDRLKEQIGSKFDGNETADLIMSVISEYLKGGGESWANANARTLIDPIAETIWSTIKDKVVEHALGPDLTEIFGVAQLASIPIEVMETAWVIHISGIRNEDIRNALKWYVVRRVAYDYERHRKLMLRGERFEAIQWSPRFPWDFDPSSRDPAPYPFEAYDLEPYYINVRENTQAVFLLGPWTIALAGPPIPGGSDDELAGFYNLWANMMYAENNMPGTQLEREIKALGKNAGQAYVRGIVKRHANAMLRDFMSAFENYYYELYRSHYLYEIRNAVRQEALILGVLKCRDREILAAKAAWQAEYAEEIARYNEMIEQQTQAAGDADAAEASADLYLQDRNAETNDNTRCLIEADCVLELIAAMNHAADGARECESERVNYASYLDFVSQYGEASASYLALECPENRTSYMAAYSPLEQDLNSRWLANASEFAALREEIVETGRLVCGEDNNPQRFFSAVVEYARKLGNEPFDILGGLSTPGRNLFYWLWWECLGDDETAYLQELSDEQFDLFLGDIDIVESRLLAHKATLDQILEDFPTRDEMDELHEKAVRADVLYSDLVKGSASLINPRGGWSTFNRSFGKPSAFISVPFYWYGVNWSVTGGLNFDEAATDLVNFSMQDYQSYAVHFLGITAINVPVDRDSPIEDNLLFNPAEEFRTVMQKVYATTEKGLENVGKARDMAAMEAARRELTPELQWHVLHELPASGLPALSALFVPQVDGWGMAMHTAITSNDVGVIGFHGGGIWTSDLSDPAEPSLLDQTSFSGHVYGLDLANGIACLSGWWNDLMLINITNPANLPSPMVERMTIPDDGGCSRDVAVRGDYAYVADDAQSAGQGSGLKVYDLRTVANNPYGQADGALALDGARSIALLSSYAYLACGSNGLFVVDVSTQTNPVVAAQIQTDPMEVLEVEVFGDMAVMAMGSNGVAVLDCATPTNPSLISIDAAPGFYVRHAVMTGDVVLAAGDILDRGLHGVVQVYSLVEDQYLVRRQRYETDINAQHIALHKGNAWISCSHFFTSTVFCASLDDLVGLEPQSATARSVDVERTDAASELFEARVELQAYGSGAGQVSLEPGGTNSSNRIRTYVATGTVVTVAAVAEAESSFVGWEGHVDTSSNTFTFVVESNTYLAAQFALPEHYITATGSVGGVIVPDGVVTVLVNQAQDFSITADGGYVISNVLVDGVAIGSVNEFTFFDVTNNRVIDAQFVAVDAGSCGVAAGAGPGGSVTPQGWMAHSEGATVEYLIEADPEFRIANVQVDGTNHGSMSSFIFTNIVGVHNLRAEFSREARVVKVDCNPGGKIEPARTFSLLPGGSGTDVLIVADPWFHIGEVLSNGIPVGVWDHSTTSAVFSFTWPENDVTLKVRFEQLTTSNTDTPLSWLAAHGITSDFEQAALLDHDGDGSATWQEYVADTDPNSEESHLEIKEIMAMSAQEGATRWTVSFNSSIDRLYEIEGIDSLNSTLQWTRVGEPFVGSGETITLQVTNEIPFLRLRSTKP